MVGFHYKHNFKGQGKIHGENGECQMNTISSDDRCVCVFKCMYACSYLTYMNVLMYICVYKHNGMKCEKGGLLTAWYTLGCTHLYSFEPREGVGRGIHLSKT